MTRLNQYQLKNNMPDKPSKPSLPSNVQAYGYGVMLSDRINLDTKFIGVHTFARELQTGDVIVAGGIVCSVVNGPDNEGMVEVRGL